MTFLYHGSTSRETEFQNPSSNPLRWEACTVFELIRGIKFFKLPTFDPILISVRSSAVLYTLELIQIPNHPDITYTSLPSLRQTLLSSSRTPKVSH